MKYLKYLLVGLLLIGLPLVAISHGPRVAPQSGLSSCADCSASFEPAGAITTHTADTTAVHGITDTSNLVDKSAAETIAGAWVLNHFKATILTSTPTPTDMSLYRLNGADADPAGTGLTYDYLGLYDDNGSAWKAFLTERGELLLKSVPTPAYSHITGGDIGYSDTSSPHVLTYSETHGGFITNAQTGGPVDKIYTVPAYDATMDFGVMVVAGAQMDIDPPSGDTLWLCISGTCTEGGVDKNIFNDDDTPWDIITCKGVEETDGVYELICYTSNTGWELES